MTYLLDANGLAALVIPQHEHHERAHRFFNRRPFAVTPLTQLALLQILTRPRRVSGQMLPPLRTPAEALRRLGLAQKNGLMLATFDEALPRQFPEVRNLLVSCSSFETVKSLFRADINSVSVNHRRRVNLLLEFAR